MKQFFTNYILKFNRRKRRDEFIIFCHLVKPIYFRVSNFIVSIQLPTRAYLFQFLFLRVWVKDCIQLLYVLLRRVKGFLLMGYILDGKDVFYTYYK